MWGGVFDFLFKYKHWLVFFMLEAFSLIGLFSTGGYQKSVYFTTANSVVGYAYSTISSITSYLNLVSENRDLEAENEKRRQIASLYLEHISSQIVTMPIKNHSVYHIFPVLSKCRNRLQHFLEEKGIQTVIHYPIPPHQQKCYYEWADRKLPVTERIHEQELSLPCHQAMTDEEIERVIDSVNHFSPC